MIKPSKEWMSILAVFVGVWNTLFFAAAAIPLLNAFVYIKSRPVVPGAPSQGNVHLVEFLGFSFSSWMGLAAALLYCFFGARALLGNFSPGFGRTVAWLDLLARAIFLAQFAAVIFKWQPTSSQNFSLALVIALPFFLSAAYSIMLILWLKEPPVKI